jgi:hypothetical protein
MIERFLIVNAVFFAACSLIGCSSSPLPPAQRSADSPPSWGSVDPRYFRDPATSVFAPLDLPAPSPQRSASGAPGPEYWQQRVDYRIEATLFAPETRDQGTPGISGTSVMTYTNNSPDALSYLWIHLEQNLYLPDSLGALANTPDEAPGEYTGGFTVYGVTVGGVGVEMAVYDTVARIDLPEPVSARGGTVEVEFAWSFPVPEHGSERMGTEDCEDGRVYQIAQWFPAACVYDDVHGWNTLPYQGGGEFYTNFGDYDVRLTVPASHLVAATGILQNPEAVLTPEQAERFARAAESADTVVIRSADEVSDPASRPAGADELTWHFRAENCRTFAWASSAAFIWDAAKLADAGPDGRGILCQSFYPREGLALWPTSTQMIRESIGTYGRHWAPYPYPVATNVNGTVYGMEYPMIVFCSDREDERELFYTTTHEFAHQWIPMMISTDERRYPWMDEGLVTFMNFDSLVERYGEAFSNLDIDAFAASLGPAQDQPAMTWHDRMWRSAAGYLAYDKPAWALLCLRRQVLGPDRFDPAFREFLRAWAFKSPQPADFFRTMENAAGADLSWFWRGWFYDTGWLDQEITSVRQDADNAMALATLTNRGRIVMPVDYLVTYDDGQTEQRRLPAEAWATTDRWVDSWETQGRRVVGLEIDPDRLLPDVRRDNNIWGR